VAIALVDWLVNVAQLKVVGRMGEQALYDLRITIFSHLQRLGLDFYERERPGHILTSMTTDVDALSSFAQSGLITLINSLLTVAGITAVLLVVDPAVGLIVLAMTPAVCVATVIFRKTSRRAYSAARNLLSSLNADLQENAAGLRAVQCCRCEQHSIRSFAHRSAAYQAAQLRGESWAALYFASVQLAVMLAGVFVMLAAVGQIHRGALTVGGVAACLVYVNMFFAPLQQLSQVYDGYQRSSVGLRRIAELLRVSASTPCSPRALTLAEPARNVARSGARIELRDVRFRYGAHEPEALTGLNLTIAPGDTVALVGQTGAGKSTVIKLIARFYDATAGSITVDGEDIRDYDLTAYRTRIGLVPQETDIFPGTVRDVIAYGRPEASNAEVAAAARAAGAYNMVSRLPGGFGYEVGEGGHALSSGQRQLLALARAYLMDPAILLLDEATAALDPATERAVLAATANVAAGRTAIVVAHRLTTAERAGRIAVLHDGRVIETGTPAALRAAGGAYAALWAAANGEQANRDNSVGGNAALPRLYQGHTSAQW
jgi:ATP-binding cassette subfamily B protein